MTGSAMASWQVCSGALSTLRTTELVHEAYLRGERTRYEQTAQFFAYAARYAYILTDAARRRCSPSAAATSAPELSDPSMVLSIRNSRRSSTKPRSRSNAKMRAAQVVELHYFAGLTCSRCRHARNRAAHGRSRLRYARIPGGAPVRERNVAARHQLTFCRMTVQLLKPRFALRELFDEVVELAPEAREAKIAMDLPPAIGVRLQAMVVFDDSSNSRQSNARHGSQRSTCPAVRAGGSTRCSSPIPRARALLKASAAEAIGHFARRRHDSGQSPVGTCTRQFRLLELIDTAALRSCSAPSAPSATARKRSP
jgi:hypothetical protein